MSLDDGIGLEDIDPNNDAVPSYIKSAIHRTYSWLSTFRAVEDACMHNLLVAVQVPN